MILAVRHGEADGNRDRRFIGQLDVPLSELGRRQAELVGDRLAAMGVERIVASDLQRAAGTAAPLARLTGIEVETFAELREVHNGEWAGLLPTEIETGWPELFAAYRSGDDVARPGGERWADVRARVVPVVEDLLAADRVTALFSHGGPLLCLAAWAAGSTHDGNVFSGPISPPTNAGIMTILSGPRLASYNDTGHLGEALEDHGGLDFID